MPDCPLTRERLKSRHATAPARDDAQKLRKLITWKHLHRLGFRGTMLQKRSGLPPYKVKAWAAKLDFDLEGRA
jgi:hypothetical protein